MTPRRLLVVPYFYPPFPGSGNRWPTMATYLRRAGHSVTVVATDAFGSLPDDEEQSVVRVADLRSARPLRRLLRRGNLTVVGAATLERPPPRLLTSLIVPDAHIVSWMPASLHTVRRLLRQVPFDCLITSSPPDTTHVIGLLLGRSRPAWIADFRDGWAFEPLKERFPTAPQRALDASLERRVAQTAEVTIGATRPIAEDLEGRLGAHAAYVPNGWDPDAARDLPSPLPRDAAVTLVHTGTISGLRGSDPEPLLRALAQIRADPAVPTVRLVLAGPQKPSDRELVERTGVAEAVSNLGVIGRAEALALQRAADALVLLTSRHASVATGKLFEYLGARRPIIALAENNEAARIVRETNTGVTVAPDDVDAIAAAIGRVASGELAATYSPRNLEPYTYPAPAQAVLRAVEDAIARRG